MLLSVNDVAVLTADTEQFLEFYGGIFDVTHEVLQAASWRSAGHRS